MDPVLKIAVFKEQVPGELRFCEIARVNSQYSCGRCYTCGFKDRVPPAPKRERGSAFIQGLLSAVKSAVGMASNDSSCADPSKHDWRECGKCALLRLAARLRKRAGRE